MFEFVFHALTIEAHKRKKNLFDVLIVLFEI